MNEDLMKAIDAGLAEEAGETPEPETEEEETVEEGEAEEETPEEEGESTEGETEDGETEDGESEDEGESEEEKPAEGEEKPAEGEKAKEEQEKEPDPVNDPIDQRLSKKTRERIEHLADLTRNISAERDTFKKNYEDHVSHIKSTGATPEQYSDALTYLKMVNSGDPTQMEQALQVMQAEVQALAKMLGKPVPGVSLLNDHPDLIQQVNAGQLTAQAAEELAGHRTRTQYMTAQSQRQQQAAQSQQAANAEIERGVADLDTLGQRLAAENPAEYAAKKAILVESLKPVFAQINPNQWAATFEAAYRRMTVAVPAPAPAKAPVPLRQPLRVKTPAGGQKAEPKNLQDAIMGLDFSKIR